MNATRSIRLMLVEDERVVAFDLKNQLQSFGYQVTATVASGEQAISQIGVVAPDLVLMDIHLDGEMDGVDAAIEIQAQHRIPVIYLTAFAEDDTLRRALESRPFGYLIKPWDARELHATIQMALARREVELAVEGSELRLKLAMEAASLGVFEWVPADNRLLGDGYLDAIFGDRPVPLDESWEAFIARVDAEDRPRVVERLAHALTAGRSVRVEFRTARTNGGPHFMEARVKAFPGVNAGRRVVGVLQDVTERHRNEDRLRQSSVVFQTAAEAIVIANAGRRITAVNPSFTRITGFREDEAVGFDTDLLLRTQRSDQDSKAFFAGLAASEEAYWQGEVFCYRRSGERFPAWQSLSVVRNSSGVVSHFVIAFSDVSEIHQVEDKLHHLAHHDPLTDLPNRLLFDDRFEQAIEKARRKKQSCLLLFIDLDGFKMVNDTLGHSQGDELLRVVAGRLRGVLRASDTVARLGGDEFVVLAGDTGVEYAGELAQKILQALRVPVDLAGDQIAVSGSIGIAVYPEHGRDRNQLMRAADIAMYSAKAEGRDGYQFYSGEMAERTSERLQIEQGLRRAIEEGQFLLHYQPQIDLASGQMIGVEALIRWRHPVHGLIPPARFIPVAEDSGLIDRIGRWVLREACREIRGQCDHTGQQLRLSVNASAHEFMHSDFLASVQSALAETGFPAGALEIEITESTLQVIERSVEIIGRLKALGISVSIDDFGTGYSSLSVLRDLPIDRIKLDRSFIKDLPANMGGIPILKAVVALAGSLRLEIIVEGIELAEQVDILRRLGCALGQGYLFCRPVPIGDLIDQWCSRRGALDGDPSPPGR